jgi:hypothetical protein
VELTRLLLRLSVPRAFVFAVPGSTAIRLTVERALRERGWAEALSPADADILVVCGDGEVGMTAMTDRVWDQIPSPRSRIRIAAQEAVPAQLDEAKSALLDLGALRMDATTREQEQAVAVESASSAMNLSAAGHDHGAMGSSAGGHDHGADHDRAAMTMPPGGHDHAAMTMPAGGQDHVARDMSGGGDHDQGSDHDKMGMVGGLAMARRGDDRDGLKLDQLHVALGPVLPDWPAGLVLRLVLQGDIAQSADLEVMGENGGGSFWMRAADDATVEARFGAAAAADSLQRLLAVAGWRSAALTGRWLRDELLSAESDAPSHPRFVRWIRRVRRSRTLRWSTNGLGIVDATEPNEELRGDATARWIRWTDEILAVAARPSGGSIALVSPATTGRAARARAAISLLPSLVTGQDLSSVRLIVASLDPDIEALPSQAHLARHG